MLVSGMMTPASPSINWSTNSTPGVQDCTGGHGHGQGLRLRGDFRRDGARANDRVSRGRVRGWEDARQLSFAKMDLSGCGTETKRNMCQLARIYL